MVFVTHLNPARRYRTGVKAWELCVLGVGGLGELAAGERFTLADLERGAGSGSADGVTQG